jgi:hypothetical protein
MPPSYRPMYPVALPAPGRGSWRGDMVTPGRHPPGGGARRIDHTRRTFPRTPYRFLANPIPLRPACTTGLPRLVDQPLASQHNGVWGGRSVYGDPLDVAGALRVDAAPLALRAGEIAYSSSRDVSLPLLCAWRQHRANDAHCNTTRSHALAICARIRSSPPSPTTQVERWGRDGATHPLSSSTSNRQWCCRLQCTGARERTHLAHTAGERHVISRWGGIWGLSADGGGEYAGDGSPRA